MWQHSTDMDVKNSRCTPLAMDMMVTMQAKAPRSTQFHCYHNWRVQVTSQQVAVQCLHRNGLPGRFFIRSSCSFTALVKHLGCTVNFVHEVGYTCITWVTFMKNIRWKLDKQNMAKKWQLTSVELIIWTVKLIVVLIIIIIISSVVQS